MENTDRKCNNCGSEVNLNTHGQEVDGVKSWVFLCRDCHKTVHPSFDEPIGRYEGKISPADY